MRYGEFSAPPVIIVRCCRPVVHCVSYAQCACYCQCYCYDGRRGTNEHIGPFARSIVRPLVRVRARSYARRGDSERVSEPANRTGSGGQSAALLCVIAACVYVSSRNCVIDVETDKAPNAVQWEIYIRNAKSKYIT